VDAQKANSLWKEALKKPRKEERRRNKKQKEEESGDEYDSD
jgi:hypothetical protein